ncbi:BamA/TamA family outer membrane protein [Flavobacteriaceae bacterium F89]|uniref:BamA/TamA family outer membrane protein n=1 Tax=Cerina litoralis TaxID=2874477 RepID=A0AAE3EV83_9FLAO|nr:BamA/TamA family outer membrane protein [Cerina litoralis]MCG2460267.1 BamA/TamA family outer membrane protein [Cerina litoralis]
MKVKSQFIGLLFILASSLASSQNNISDSKPKFTMAVLKDSLDGKLDMSDFLIHFHGFIPVVQLITEPALGNIGFMLAPVFIQPNKHQTEGKYVPPDITLGFVGYTANKSWGFGGVRIASLPQYHLKYRVGAAYGDVNMDFYRNFPVIGEQEFAFNFNMTAAFTSVLRQIGKTELYVGLEYLYLHNNVKPEFEFEDLPDFIGDKDLKNNLSSVGINAEYDKRDNLFTPNTGWFLTTSFKVNASWTGSDYNYENLNLSAFKYLQLSPKWVSGFRFESTIQWDDAPFYMKPSISMRGVPMAKYQGDQTYVLETEQRFDWTLRWSSVVFGGLAKAPTKKVSFDNSELVYNYGTGFRYLIARKFKMRAGVDVAWSNDDFGWYVIFGSAWNNKN